VVTGSNPLIFLASEDDGVTPEIDGFTSGNTIVFRLWDSSESREIFIARPTYYMNEPAADTVYTPNGFSIVSSVTGYTVSQQFDFQSGWNLMSCYLVPDEMNLFGILYPLIESNALVKAIDESGGFIQEIPGIGWMNTIGNMSNTKGYYIKVNQNSQLTLYGALLETPYNIPLYSGWNIISYPIPCPGNPLEILEPLINSSRLIKVINQSGGFIQYIPAVGWMNTIGDFEPGEGYYIKVNENCIITVERGPPTVITENVIDVTPTTAICQAELIHNCGAVISARGVCWSTSLNPTLIDDYTTEGTGMGPFVSTLTGLDSLTQYYCRAYSTSDEGTGYGVEVAFTTISSVWNCGDTIVDPRDGRVYNTVSVGNQCWMAENLNIGTRIDGASEQTDNSVIEKFCYNDDESNCDTYGGLYQWDEMMQYVSNEGSQGICKYGWHLPSDDEWKILEGNADTQYGVDDPEWNGTQYRGFDAGKRLKTTTTGTDIFGFSAQLSGYRDTPGYFRHLGAHGYFGISTGTVLDYLTFGRGLSGSYDEVYRTNTFRKYYGVSVRCLKD